MDPGALAGHWVGCRGSRNGTSLARVEVVMGFGVRELVAVFGLGLNNVVLCAPQPMFGTAHLLWV